MTDPRDDVYYTKQKIVYARMLQQLSAVEKELSALSRKSSKRPALIERKTLLLRSMTEEKLRLREMAAAKKETDHPVTDHALVRWLERKAKVDVQKLKDSILSDELEAALNSKEKTFYSDGEMVFVLADSRVLTVMRKDEMWEEIA